MSPAVASGPTGTAGVRALPSLCFGLARSNRHDYLVLASPFGGSSAVPDGAPHPSQRR